MSKPLLSILIPTVVGREESFERLMWLLKWQLHDSICSHVEILWEKDNKEMPIGTKREKLYQRANGLFGWMLDDDDSIANDGIHTIVDQIKLTGGFTDCITFQEHCIMDGVYKSSNHSLKYEKWQDNFDGFDYVRTPFYKDVIKTEIAKSVPFEVIRYNEDERWSMELKKVLKNEIHIDRELYFYQYTSTPHHERYGFHND